MTNSRKYQYQIEPQLSKIYQDEELPVVTANRNARVFVVAGMPGAGKTHICHVMASRFGGLFVPGNGPAGAFGAVLSAVGEDRRGRWTLGPSTVFVDDYRDEADLERMTAFFFPRVRFILARARPVTRRKRLREAGRVASAAEESEGRRKMRHLQTLCKPTPKAMYRVTTDGGVRPRIAELVRFCGLTVGGRSDTD
jgi:hypothetical protein